MRRVIGLTNCNRCMDAVRTMSRPLGGSAACQWRTAIRVTRWITLHGIALNVEPELSHFGGIVPCGVSASRYGVTSFADLGHVVSMPDVDMVLRREFETLFGATLPDRSHT